MLYLERCLSLIRTIHFAYRRWANEDDAVIKIIESKDDNLNANIYLFALYSWENFSNQWASTLADSRTIKQLVQSEFQK